MSENIYKDAWFYVIDEIKNQYAKENREREFNLNFNISYVDDSENKITACVANNFMKGRVESTGVLETIQNKIREITGQDDIIIDCIVNSESSSSEISKTSNETINKSSSNLFSSLKFDTDILNSENDTDDDDSYEEQIRKIQNSSKTINSFSNTKNFVFEEKFTFDTFVPGDNNNYAYKAAQAAAKNPGKDYNPILFYGGSGLGKTHLMKAIGNYINANSNEKLNILYTTAENFGNDFTNSLASKKMKDFTNKYRNLDVLLLDDIHFLNKKVSMQEALFYTFEALDLKKAQMVFTCDRPIREIKEMAERLVSRLSKGLTINLDPPNYETRYAILLKKTTLENKYLEPEIIDYIAKNVETNVRDLEAALNRVFGYADLIGQNPTLEIVKSQLKDIFVNNKNENISIETIQEVIANDYQVSVADLKSVKRDKKFVIPRQIAIYLSRELTEMALTEIGDAFGGKDHTTIMHAIKKIEDLIKTDSSLDARVKAFKKEIKEYNKN